MNRPTVEQMISIGYGCGLGSVEEAYHQMMSHYDCFFYLGDIDNQMKLFHEDLIEAGILYKNEESGVLDWTSDYIRCTDVLKEKFGYTDADIKKLEEGPEEQFSVEGVDFP